MKIHSLALGLGLLILLSANSCQKQDDEVTKRPSNPGQASATTNELKIEDVTVGSGAEAVVGKTVKVHYTGTFENGSKFDSSKDHGEPFSFKLGAGQVIKGWDQGVAGMKVGGVRKLVIPPSLGYGSRQVGPIPANSTLLFEVELLEIL